MKNVKVLVSRTHIKGQGKKGSREDLKPPSFGLKAGKGEGSPCLKIHPYLVQKGEQKVKKIRETRDRGPKS